VKYPTWPMIVSGAFILLTTSVSVSYAFWKETNDDMKDKVDNEVLLQLIQRQEGLILEIKEMRKEVSENRIRALINESKLEDK
jgi:hypothetical protein